MTTTTTELRAQLDALKTQHDSIYRELTPTAKPAANGKFRWSDEDLARWMGCDVDLVRGWVVQHLVEFGVNDDCVAALLTVPQIVTLTLTVNAPRVREIDFLDAQMSLVTSRLRELDGGLASAGRR